MAGILHRASLIFESKAGGYPSGAPNIVQFFEHALKHGLVRPESTRLEHLTFSNSTARLLDDKY